MQSLELSSSVFSSTSSYASSSLFEHGSSADSHTDSSPPIPDLPESKGTPSAGRVAYFAHPISRRRDRKPYVFLEEDLGYDAESEDLPTRRPSTSRSCVKRRVSSGQARRASRRKASDNPNASLVGLGLGLPSDFSFSGGAAIDSACPPKPRLMATLLSESPSPVFLSAPAAVLQVSMDVSTEDCALNSPKSCYPEMSPPSSTVLSSLPSIEYATGLGLAYQPKLPESPFQSFVEIPLSPAMSHIPLVEPASSPLSSPSPMPRSFVDCRARWTPRRRISKWRSLLRSPYSPSLMTRRNGRPERAASVSSLVASLQGVSLVGR